MVGLLALLTVAGSVARAVGSHRAPTIRAAPPSASNSGDEGNVSAPGAPTVAGAVAPGGSGADAGPSACRSGYPLANVYHPNRLKVVQSCVTISGTVRSVRHEDDGDVHFDIALDGAYAGMLTQANMTSQHGWLVVEIVPADEPGCTPGRPPKPATGTYDYGICTGADEMAPAVASHVSVTGPYVLDEDHGGWAEVHPAWAISSSNFSQLPAPETTTTGHAASAAPTTTAAAGAWCSASAGPSNDGYRGDYEVYVHSDQPGQKATATDAGDTWSRYTDSSGYADIRLYHTSPGEPITVRVGAASCSTTA